MFMPCLRYGIAMKSDYSPNRVELPGGKTVIGCQLDRLKPEVTRPAFPKYMNVNRLIAVEAIEEEPVEARDTLDSPHSIVWKPLLKVLTMSGRVDVTFN